ncbi:3-keto-disaccharide hydrolase [Pontibacter sp. H249]|uniref:3-keto-disaccharide hydrolase n=1 Tax=Pontibacter sp. H249 TaxID=3133420 RepID=UPI0030C24E2F
MSDWKSLFDGSSLQGWHRYGKDTVGKAWRAEAGAIRFVPTANDRGDLVTDQSFGNFHLKLDWKISRGGNSGLLFYVQEDAAQYKYSWMSGPEIQLLDNERHPDAQLPKRKAGDLYDLIAAEEGAVKPAGEWNSTELICDNGHLIILLNSQTILSATLWDTSWKALIANSKFANIPRYGTYKSGKIALQDHEDEVWFRNILIKEISS